jgi:hypothetical protein
MQKTGTQLKEPVGLETIHSRRTDMVNGQDDAGPGHEGPHDVVSGAEIERLKTSTHDASLQGLQDVISWPISESISSLC